MKVYASDPFNESTENSKIRNFKFKTEQESAGEWFVPDGVDCWMQCNQQPGSCSFCGHNGYCCSGDSSKVDYQGDCTLEMIETIQQSIFGNTTYHMCVAKKIEDSCSEWNTKKNTNCPYNDLQDPVKFLSINDCQDACLTRQPECIGVAVATNESPMRCWLKTNMDSCGPHNDRMVSKLSYYQCADNNDCDGSFVSFKDVNFGHQIGNAKSYCGNKTPPDFYSLGSKAKVEIRIDSVTSGQTGIPEFRSQFKAELCNREYTDKNDIITSPNYPGLYPNSLHCTILIAIADSHQHGAANIVKLALFFAQFELESSQNCETGDYLKIDSGKALCGSMCQS